MFVDQNYFHEDLPVQARFKKVVRIDGGDSCDGLGRGLHRENPKVSERHFAVFFFFLGVGVGGGWGGWCFCGGGGGGGGG